MKDNDRRISSRNDRLLIHRKDEAWLSEVEKLKELLLWLTNHTITRWWIKWNSCAGLSESVPPSKKVQILQLPWSQWSMRYDVSGVNWNIRDKGEINPLCDAFDASDLIQVTFFYLLHVSMVRAEKWNNSFCIKTNYSTQQTDMKGVKIWKIQYSKRNLSKNVHFNANF